MEKYGPFTSLLELGGFLLAAAVGFAILLWGTGLNSSATPKSQRRLFKVLVSITLIVALALVVAYGKYMSTIVLACLVGVFFVVTIAAVFGLARMDATATATVVLFANTLAVTASALTLMAATFLVERANAKEVLFPEAPLKFGGDPESEGMATLRGLESERANISLDGSARFEATNRGPSGRCQYLITWQVGTKTGTKSDVRDFGPISPAVGYSSAPVSTVFPIEIPSGAQHAASIITVRIQFVKAYEARGVGGAWVEGPLPGQLIKCFMDVKVKVSAQ